MTNSKTYLPFFMPIVRYVKSLPEPGETGEKITLAHLCRLAGVACRASGAWTQREITLIESDQVCVMAKPHQGPVAIFLPMNEDRYRIALAVMAYSVHDLVARKSIRHAPWRRDLWELPAEK